MKVTLNKAVGPRTIAATGQRVEPGDSVEVDDDLGDSLCEQSDVWSKATAKKASKQEGDK